MTWTIVDGPCSSSTSPSATARRGTWKAIRTGTQGLALLRAAGSSFESAQIENDLAMAYLTGNVARAREPR